MIYYLTSGVFCYAKRSTKQTIYAGVQENGCRNHEKRTSEYVCLWDPTFAAYLAKKRAEGKHYNVAISHAAKKLVRLIFALEKSRQPYNLAA